MEEGSGNRTARSCPICGRSAETKHRPFCSARCAMIDLGRWLKGDYRIPAEEPPDDLPDEGRDE
jgi:endogenous inhibitor of DNA gyrase (YacG/DUF329 family)